MDSSSVSCDSYSDGYSYRDCQLQNDYCNSNFDTPFVNPNDVGVLIVSTFFFSNLLVLSLALLFSRTAIESMLIQSSTYVQNPRHCHKTCQLLARMRRCICVILSTRAQLTSYSRPRPAPEALGVVASSKIVRTSRARHVKHHAS